MKPAVSIVITAKNYGRYLPKAIESCLCQTCSDFELMIVDDGSTDNTSEILRPYEGNKKITILKLSGVGLASACNRGIAKTSGDYLIRLDADDYFDENIIQVEKNILDSRDDVDLVFSDYFRVDERGEIIDYVRKQKINDEVEFFDRNPLAAGAMFRRKCFDKIGGYTESLRFQEDYDFWLRFIKDFKVHNVNLPLMYYRQHNVSMSKNTAPRRKARQYVKRTHREKAASYTTKKILGLIPAMVGHRQMNREILAKQLASKTVLQHCIENLLQCSTITESYVSTDDEEIARKAKEGGALVPFLRSGRLTEDDVSLGDVAREFVLLLEQAGKEFDLVVIASPNYPFLEKDSIEEAIDTLMLHEFDSVIAVKQDTTFHWRLGNLGLCPYGISRHNIIQEGELVFRETGGLRVVQKRNLFQNGSFLGEKIGYVEISSPESLRVGGDQYSYWLAEHVAESWNKQEVDTSMFLYEKNKLDEHD